VRPPRSLATRIFLMYFPAMCVALAAGFFAINSMVRSRIKEGLKTSLHGIETVLAKTDSEHDRYTTQLLAMLSENAGLKASMGLYREISGPESVAQARRTVQLQLRELTEMLDYNLAIVSDADGQPIAVLVNGSIVDRPLPELADPSALLKIGETLYETTTVPINLGDENLGHLTVGRQFEFGSLAHIGYAALFESGHLLLTNLSMSQNDLAAQIAKQCGVVTDGCEIQFEGTTYLALRVRRARLGHGYDLLSFQPLDAAIEQFTRGFRSTFLLISGCGVLAALLLSAVVSRSVIRPLTDLVDQLRSSESTGSLSPGFHAHSSTEEVNRLAEALNRAALSVRESRQNLESAYVEFVETMAQALDARDAYTAGHSHRVSEYSVAIARAMGLAPEKVQLIRIGAELHDIGKIGIPDDVLQKPGRLSKEEFDLIKQHPQIGKRILEKVGRFDQYLPIVELHHENYDGTGYPHGLKGNDVPMEARIVHVADVYDAITSDRAYRRAMSSLQVFELLERGTGTQFDPEVMEAFMGLLHPEEAVCEEQLATI
jgi:putative nucleotidyltransferase with HDIG domain